MKLVCAKRDFQKSLETVSSVIETKTSIPVLNNILLETIDHHTIKLSATNLEIGIECYVNADVHRQGHVTLPGKKFSSIVRELHDEINIQTHQYNTFVKSGNSDLRIVGMPKDEFPKIAVNTKSLFSLPQKTLRELLEKTSFSMSTDDTRYILKGVYISLEEDRVIFVATDGKRLSYVKESVENLSGKSARVVLPANSVHELKRILEDEGDVSISITETHITFMCQHTHIVSKIIEGSYPDYEQVIPKQNPNTIAFDKNEFLNILKRAVYFVADENRRVELSIRENIMSIKAASSGFGEFDENIEVKANVSDIDIAFNFDYILNVAKHVEGEKIVFEMSSPERPIIIREGMNILFLIMPMRIDDEL